jgi:L-ascorbate metabolism protein UlaG (beta-lactamase superfamily)
MFDFSRNSDHLYRLYITGYAMLSDGLEDVPRRYPDVDFGLIHTGGTTFLLTVVTTTGQRAVKVVEITKPRTAIPIRYNDFAVFLSGLDESKDAAEAATTYGVRLPHSRRDLHIQSKRPKVCS